MRSHPEEHYTNQAADTLATGPPQFGGGFREDGGTGAEPTVICPGLDGLVNVERAAEPEPAIASLESVR